MSFNLMKVAKEQLREKILESLGSCISDGKLPMQPIMKFIIEIPENKEYGDLATNVAMACAKSFKMPPIQIAQTIIDNISLKETYFEKYNIISPGFINFFFKKSWFKDILKGINLHGANYGRSNIGQKEKVMIEFVSANPTGPMHMGNARGGSLGDCLASVLDFCGYNVSKEFYVNDAGNQIEKFGKSLEARYLQIFKGNKDQFPEDGYHGEDIKILAQSFAEINSDNFVNEESDVRIKALVNFSLPKNIAKMKEDLKKYRIEYDNWFKESTLHKNAEIDKVIELLKKNNVVYEKEGALWYQATKYGAEKDEVLIRANGYPTYFAVDIAYHYNKFVVRGFDKAIDIWGADHHGHVARLKGAINALGLENFKLDIILMQLVRFVKDGEIIKMSKRTGESITLDNLLDEVSVDAARFFFNMREYNSHLDFDMDLAVEQSSKNPVYYVQYAYARICSILDKVQGNAFYVLKVEEEGDYLYRSEEKELIKMLAIFPEELEQISFTYDSSDLTKYAINLASIFHKFYNSCRVVSDDKILTSFRLYLCDCTKIVLQNVLSILKIDAPVKM